MNTTFTMTGRMSHFTMIVVGSLTGFYLLYEKKDPRH